MSEKSQELGRAYYWIFVVQSWLDSVIKVTDMNLVPNSRRQWKTGGPGVLWSVGSRRVRHDLTAKQQQHLLVATQWWRVGFHLNRAYFGGVAYMTSILKNHTRAYFQVRSYFRGNRVS